MNYKFHYITMHDDRVAEADRNTDYYLARKQEARRNLSLVYTDRMITLYKDVIDECNEML